MPDVCTLLQGIQDDIRALRDNFIDVQYNSGVSWRSVNGKLVGSRQYGGWTEKRSVNFQVLYEQIITYAGTTMTINLDFLVNVMLRRAEMIHSDNIAKTYEIRYYSDYNHDSNYNLLKASTANQDTRWFQGYENLFMPAGSRVQLYFSGFTAGKTNKVIIGVEEI
jgi:hypothetical protein